MVVMSGAIGRVVVTVFGADRVMLIMFWAVDRVVFGAVDKVVMLVFGSC